MNLNDFPINFSIKCILNIRNNSDFLEFLNLVIIKVKLNILNFKHCSISQCKLLKCLVFFLWDYISCWIFQNCPPLFSVMLLSSPVPRADVLKSSSTDSSHPNWGSPTRRVPSSLILSPHLRQGHHSGLFHPAFPIKTLYTSVPSPTRATCPNNSVCGTQIV
jgi:hypothetical protein